MNLLGKKGIFSLIARDPGDGALCRRLFGDSGGMETFEMSYDVVVKHGDVEIVWDRQSIDRFRQSNVAVLIPKTSPAVAFEVYKYSDCDGRGSLTITAHVFTSQKGWRSVELVNQ